MNHAEVLERLEAAALGPGRLGALDADRSAEGEELRRHLDSCASCLAEREALELVGAALAAGAPDTLRAPVEARGRVLAAVVAGGVTRGPAGVLPVSAPIERPGAEAPPQVAPAPVPAAPVPGASPEQQSWTVASGTAAGPMPMPPPPGSRRGRSPTATARAASAERAGGQTPGYRWLVIGAAAAVLVFVAGALLGGPLGFTQTTGPTTAEFAKVMSATADILGRPGHKVAGLATADGSVGGAVAVSPGTGWLTIISASLPEPPQGARYECLLERTGEAPWRIGYMRYASGTAYWAGQVKDPVDVGLQGDRLVVLLEGSTGVPALSGTF
jgi:hypothetical protein